MADFNFAGNSGTYPYWWLDISSASNIAEKPGNYGFLKSIGNNRWAPVYWGQSENLRMRLSNHDRWEEAKKLGANRVVAHTQPIEKLRLNEEADLIAKWQPVLNSQMPQRRLR